MKIDPHMPSLHSNLSFWLGVLLVLCAAGLVYRIKTLRPAAHRCTVAELDTLYIDGQGHLTTDGHDWVAREVCTHLFSACLGDR